MSLQNLHALQIWTGKFSSTWKILIVFSDQYDRWQEGSASVKLLFWNHDSCWCYHSSYDLGRGHFVFLWHFLATPFRFFFPCFCVLSWHEGKWQICHWHLWEWGQHLSNKLMLTLQSSFSYFTYIFTVYCSMHSTVVVTSLGKLLTRSKRFSILTNIIMNVEWNCKSNGKRGQN
jgi:hypothetical protein